MKLQSIPALAGHSNALSYDEIKYKPNDKVIMLLNAAIEDDEASALNFFSSLPAFRIANLFVDSQTTRPLDSRYLYSIHDLPKPLTLEIVDALLVSGFITHGYSIIDKILLAATNPQDVQYYLQNIDCDAYASSRLRPAMTLVEVDTSAKFRSEVIHDLCDGDTFLAARQKVVNADEAYQNDIHLEAAHQLATKVFSGSARYDDFRNMREFIDNLYLEDPTFIVSLYRLGGDIVRRAIEVFLSDLQINRLAQNYRRHDMSTLLANREQLASVIEISEKDQLDSIMLDKSTPVLISFGAKWCSPCQHVQVDFQYAARLWSGKMRLVHADIDHEDMADALTAHKKFSKGPGIPDGGVYVGGKYRFSIYDIEWVWDKLKNIQQSRKPI